MVQCAQLTRPWLHCWPLLQVHLRDRAHSDDIDMHELSFSTKWVNYVPCK